MPVTPQMMNDRREDGCISITAERKYYRKGGCFIKRTLRPSEWQTHPVKGTLHIPRQARERALNEAASMEFIARATSIPIPELVTWFEDDEAVYLIMKEVPGVTMDTLSNAERMIVEKELDSIREALHNLRSKAIGGPSGQVVPPYRVTEKSARLKWDLKSSDKEEFKFCHMDLTMPNIIVDPITFKIRAVLDWEYAGFYPEHFDCQFYKRSGASVALDGEEDDADELLNFLNSW